ncbi:MAG: MinD/ParA family protein [Deltaproteobacteria bacterium]|nr:MinD/ParA family protein [Deltaproteobacteria bacterium]
MPRVIAVTSGKGGVGKSNFVLNVGIALGMMDNRVQLLDADLGLANLDVLMGLRPLRTLEDVVLGKCNIEDIILKTDYGVELLPGSSGVEDMADLPREKIAGLIKQISKVSGDADFILVDTASGISSTVLSFLLGVPEVVVGVAPEPTSLTDAYAMIKVLTKNGFKGRVSVFPSMVKDSTKARNLYRKISSAAQRFLDMKVDYAGYVCMDDKLPQAVADQVPVIVRFPTSEIARCYMMIASTLLGQEAGYPDMDRFWSRLIQMIIKRPKKKVHRGVSIGAEDRVKSLEAALRDMLDEQRKTRILLERLVTRMEQTSEELMSKKGPVV